VDGLLTELQNSQGMISSLTQPCEATCTLQSQNTEVVTVVDLSSDNEDEMPTENVDADATTIKTCACQNNREATKCRNYHITDVTLSNCHISRDIPNNWVLITTSEKSKCNNERAIADAIGANMKKRKRNNPTTITKMIFGAFAASQLLKDEVAVCGSPRSLTVLPAFGSRSQTRKPVTAGTNPIKRVVDKRVLSWAEIASK
jgi:hypothetical protein